MNKRGNINGVTVVSAGPLHLRFVEIRLQYVKNIAHKMRKMGMSGMSGFCCFEWDGSTWKGEMCTRELDRL